jgi:hypothetical protein
LSLFRQKATQRGDNTRARERDWAGSFACLLGEPDQLVEAGVDRDGQAEDRILTKQSA